MRSLILDQLLFDFFSAVAVDNEKILCKANWLLLTSLPRSLAS